MTRSRYISGMILEIPDGTRCVYCYAESQKERRRPPAFHCARCDRHIARRRSVALMKNGAIFCIPCLEGDGSLEWEANHPSVTVGSQAAVRVIQARGYR